jgi:Family of unknown function (DUF6069)
MEENMLQSATPTWGSGQGLVRRVIVVVVAAVVTSLAWLVGRLAGVDYVAETPLGTREVTLALTVVASVVSGLIAWIVVVVLERYSASARALWIAVGLVVLGASLVPTLTTTADLATKVTLSALHCVAAGVLIPGLLPHSSVREKAAP